MKKKCSGIMRGKCGGMELPVPAVHLDDEGREKRREELRRKSLESNEVALACRKRDIQRKELLDGLMEKAGIERSFIFDLVVVVLMYLDDRLAENLPEQKIDRIVSTFFFEEFLDSVKRFERTEDEGDFLAVNFLGRLVSAVAADFVAVLRQEQAKEREKFGVIRKAGRGESNADRLAAEIRGEKF